MKVIKKKYSKPALEELEIDNEISLMMTSNDTGPGDGFSAAAESKRSNPPKKSDNSFEKNPFE